MKLAPHGDDQGWTTHVPLSTVEFLQAARQRVAFQNDLRRGRAEMWTHHGLDHPGILRDTIRVINGSSDGSDPDRSIRSLLSASVDGRYCMYLATDQISATTASGADDELSPFHTQPPTDISMLIDRSPLIEGRLFVDLAFEVPRRVGERTMLLSRAVEIGQRLALPIGYLHMPMLEVEGDRFRIGFGVPAGDDRLEIDVVTAATAVGRDAGCGLWARSRLLGVWSQFLDRGGVAPFVAEGSSRRWELSVVAEARVGLISELVEGLRTSGAPPAHAVMAILEGCTVATLGGYSDHPEEALAAQLDAVAGSIDSEALQHSHWIADAPTVVPLFATGDVDRAPSPAALWVGWRCANVPGALIQLLDALNGPLGDRYNITYVASRLLGGGRVSAGRLRAVPTEDVAVDARLDVLRRSLDDDLPAPLVIDVARQESDLRHNWPNARNLDLPMR